MKLIVFLSLVLCLSAVAQPNPINRRAMAITGLLSSVYTPASEPTIRYYWVASDNPLNVKVTNWVDRIQGNVYTNSQDSLRPTNSSTGVGFTGSTYLTNTTIFTINATAGRTGCVWGIIKPITPAGSVGGIIGALDTSGYGFYANNGGNFQDFGGSSSSVICPYTSGSMLDFVINCTNSATGYTEYYTNGVIAKIVSIGDPFNGNIQFLGNDGTKTAFYKGWVVETAWFYTNLLSSTVTKLHKYATNTYGFTP